MRARIDGGVIVEDVTDHLVVVTVTGQAAVLGMSDALWELDRRGDLAVYAAIVLAPFEGTHVEIDVNPPDSVPSSRDALRKLLAAAGGDGKAVAGGTCHADLVGAIAGLKKDDGAVLIAELQEEDPQRLDAAVTALDGQVLRVPQRLVNTALHSEERLWALRKKASRSEGEARRRHLERADLLLRHARQ